MPRDTIYAWNPDWTDEMIEKARTGQLEPVCHDKTDHLGIVCVMGHQNHIHRSQVEPLPRRAEIFTRCKTCGREITLYREDVLAAMDEAWGRNG